jgi:hypothetical protein
MFGLFIQQSGIVATLLLSCITNRSTYVDDCNKIVKLAYQNDIYSPSQRRGALFRALARARVLIPSGYLHPGKGSISEV